MSETIQAEKSTTIEFYDDVPGADKNHKALVARQKWDEFQNEVKARESDFAAMLPPNIRRDRFIAAALAAAKQTPELLFADKRTLFAALTKAAQDGLLPDGREGVITVYNTKQKSGSYLKQAQWNPMIHGIRKRARELDEMLIDAQVVYENDVFEWEQGDNPRIKHVPAKLGTSTGEMVGAYAIFKRENGTILHREVMPKDQIEMTRNQSRDKDGLMWTKFTQEAWRKTVVRRGAKSAPVSEGLQQIINRDDDLFDLQSQNKIAIVPPPAPSVIPPRAPTSHKPTTDADLDIPASLKREQPKKVGLPGDWKEYLDRQIDEYKRGIESLSQQSVCDAVTDNITAAQERGELSAVDAERVAEAWNGMIGS